MEKIKETSNGQVVQKETRLTRDAKKGLEQGAMGNTSHFHIPNSQ